MKGFVSNDRLTVLGWAMSLPVLWVACSLLILPYRFSWPGFAWLALALVAALWMGASAPRSLEPLPSAATVAGAVPGRRRLPGRSRAGFVAWLSLWPALLAAGSPAPRADVSACRDGPSPASGALAPSLTPSSTDARCETASTHLEGRRYEALRVLARHLDESARRAISDATDDAQGKAGSWLPSIRFFARGAAHLHGKVDNYRPLSFELDVLVDDLVARSHDVSDRIGLVQGLERTRESWDAVLAVLGRVRLLVREGDAEGPGAPAVAALSGARLREFRQLAREVDANATEAHRVAGQELGDYPDRGQQFLGELHYFAAQSRNLRRGADAAAVDPQQIEPMVSRLLEDARQSDRSMRDARVFTSVWVGSGSTITMLHRMASLVSS